MRAARLFATALLLGACAAEAPEPEVRLGTAVTFASDPSGASVETTAGPRCAATPCTLEIASEDIFVALYRLGTRTRILRVEPSTGGTVMAVFDGIAAVPAPAPTPVSGTIQAPGPLPQIDPNPPPQADPEPVLAAVPVATPAPEPAPTREPVPTSEPAPVPEPALARGPDPASAPAPAPVVATEDKPLFEGSPFAFTQAEVAAFCSEPWTTRRDPETGRSEYNPCRAREAFR
ncbi:MAG: hypothetical protein AAGC57_01250 [Pseudomonadota bacterium]